MSASRLSIAALMAFCLSGCMTTVVGGAVGVTAAAVKTTGKVAAGTVKITGKAAGAVIPGGGKKDKKSDG